MQTDLLDCENNPRNPFPWLKIIRTGYTLVPYIPPSNADPYPPRTICFPLFYGQFVENTIYAT